MMTDRGFPSPASNPAPFVVTAEAFLGLTSQVQALAGMVQTMVPYLPQLMHLIAHQSAPPIAPLQTESLVAPNLRWSHHSAKSRKLMQLPRLRRQLGRKVTPAIRVRPKPTTASLLGLVQGSDEPLSQFVWRFTSQVQGIPDLHPSLAI
ncbi:hypothetical protein BHE74_00045384 [Ensete ventricosum]|nr:hypothetical protein BHE74_00045384 [Ensete ventricosum]